MLPLLDIKQGVEILHQGGIIAYPTESVYGLGCDPQNQQAIEKLLLIKKRAAGKGFILVGAQLGHFSDYLDFSNFTITDEILNTWPGPVTWLLPANLKQSALLRGGFSTQAVRVSAHPVVHALCDGFEHPVLSTSANCSGERPARTIKEIILTFGQCIDGIIDGELGVQSAPSQIRDGLTGAVIRN